jgi:hypothetical protein
MAIGSLLPWVAAQWFTDAGDAVLSGGRVYFYAVGTTTPKPVYQDYQRLAAHPQPVVLSSSGHATVFLGDGGYKVVLTDESGAILDTKDGIFGGSGNFVGLGSNATVGFFKLYADVRALTDGPDVVYVSGRTVEGDGGQGLFQLLPGSSIPDDDGIYLVAGGGSFVYKRIFDESINPEWFGVKYDVAIDQSARLNAALAASVYLNFPVLVTRQVYLSANITLPTNASLRTNEDGYFSSGSSVSITFPTGSRFACTGSPFRAGIQPAFVAGTIDALRLSWFSGTDSSKWARLLASTAASFPLLMDVSTTLTSDLTIPANFALEPVGGTVVTFGGFANLSIGSLNYRGLSQLIAYLVDSYVGSVSIGADVCYLEWFGGSSANTGAQNAIPFRACLLSERVDLLPSKVYTVTSTNAISFANTNTVRINGNGSTLVLNQDVSIAITTETREITIDGTGTLNFGGAVFWDSIIFSRVTGGAKAARRSTLTNVNSIVESYDSSIFGFSGQIGGNLSDCSISFSGTGVVNGSWRFAGCKFQKVAAGGTPLFTAPTDPAKIEFNGCKIDIDGLLCYSENTSLTIDLIGCTSTDSFAKALSNGYAKVNLKGCGVVNNSNVYSIDGVDLEVANTIPMGSGHAATVITSATTNWKGLGSPTSDGTSLTLGSNATLSSDPYSPNTIRCIAYGLFDAAWRYGGIFETEITYPVGSPPDPATELVVMFCHPPTANVATVGVNAYGDGNYFNTMPVELGKSLPAKLPILASAKLKMRTNVWGGQVDFRAVSEPHSTYTVSDIWGDSSVSVPTNTNTFIPEAGRLVIYNAGAGILPAGTKIKVTYRYDLPIRDQFRKFFPDQKALQNISSSIYLSAPLSYQAVRVRTSLTAGYSGQTQLSIPFMFRDCDENGMQAALCIRETDTLPFVQWNSATLALGWS